MSRRAKTEPPPRPYPPMRQCQLRTIDGLLVCFIEVPVFKTPPRILVWGNRFFVLVGDRLYFEAVVYVVPPGACAVEPEAAHGC